MKKIIIEKPVKTDVPYKPTPEIPVQKPFVPETVVPKTSVPVNKEKFDADGNAIPELAVPVNERFDSTGHLNSDTYVPVKEKFDADGNAIPELATPVHRFNWEETDAIYNAKVKKINESEDSVHDKAMAIKILTEELEKARHAV